MPIRVVGIVTSIIWVLLIAVVAFSAYSIKDVGIQVDPPTATMIGNRELLLSTPIRINNTGFTDIEQLNLTTQVFDPNHMELSNSCSIVPTIPQHGSVVITHNITLNIEKIVQNDSQFLFKDANLTVTLYGGLNLAGLLPATISANMSLPWGAPLYNFSLGVPWVSLFNSTHILVTLPVSFENHAMFNVDGNLKLEAFDSNNVLQFEGQKDLSVSPNNKFAGSIDLYTPRSSDNLLGFSNGHIDVTFSSSLFNYGPWVIPFG